MKKARCSALLKKIKQATRENPYVISDIQTKDGKRPERYRCDCKVIWASDEKKEYTGVVGKLTDIDKDYDVVSALKDAAVKHSRSAEFSNSMTGLRIRDLRLLGMKRGFCFSICRLPMILYVM